METDGLLLATIALGSSLLTVVVTKMFDWINEKARLRAEVSKEKAKIYFEKSIKVYMDIVSLASELSLAGADALYAMRKLNSYRSKNDIDFVEADAQCNKKVGHMEEVYDNFLHVIMTNMIIASDEILTQSDIMSTAYEELCSKVKSTTIFLPNMDIPANEQLLKVEFERFKKETTELIEVVREELQNAILV